MGSKQSSHAKLTTDDKETVDIQQAFSGSNSVRGRKTTNNNNFHKEEATETTDRLEEDFVDDIMMHGVETQLTIEEEDEDDEESEYDDDEDDEEEDEERQRILNELQQMKQWANFYMHPEKKVEMDGTAMARCYFDRFAAPEMEDEFDDNVMQDVQSLKQLAMDYMHPEVSVVTRDSTVCARCYFDRFDAPELVDDDDVADILDDAVALKKLAMDYYHPELPVVVTDLTACGRNYFSRVSAPDEQEESVLEQVLADAASLKKLATDYLHPELPVVTTDPSSFGRNYFSRPSAPEESDDDEDEEDDREEVLADMAALKKLAIDYLHPELPVVTTDPTSMGRNYFSRPSAMDQEEDAEREQIMADVAALKSLAVDYLHPEMPVATTDSTIFGRNYFSRLSAQVDENMEDREQVLRDAAALKKLAVDYCHPELPFVTDPTCFGRNYFMRPSALEQEEYDDEERDQIMADLAALKKNAADYLHPELPVVASDPTSFGRNYFARPSAVEQEDEEEREQILADVAALKKSAVDYFHPEVPVVTTDPTLFGRNFFVRPSAIEQEESEEEEERQQVLADVAALKKLAVDNAYPNLPVVTTDPTIFGRNYFGRPSAIAQEEIEEEEEIKQIVADMVALKKLAVDYAHPEKSVVTTDPAVFGRNYFTRPSAPPQDLPDEADDRKFSLETAVILEKSAVDFAHPEIPCVTTDPAATGRGFFSRPSAPGHTGLIHTSGYDNNAKHEAACDESWQEHHDEHHDHFAMDEDIWDEMYSSLDLPNSKPEVVDKNKMNESQNTLEEEEEGKLSRSPSSVMLFEQGMEGY